MFIIKEVHDIIRIPPSLLDVPTVQAIHSEIDQKYPNRVLMDVGLVIARYGDFLSVGHGVCVAGDGGTHHECRFRLIVFRPFCDEVCVGRIVKSTAERIQVSMGFFEDIFIPAYWMLRPSRFEEKRKLWVWTPDFDDEEQQEKADETVDSNTNTNQKTIAVKQEENATSVAVDNVDNDVIEIEEENRYEMELGSEIRFKVKSINFTQVTNTAKGMQATTTTTEQSNSSSGKVKQEEDGEPDLSRPVRQRSSSVGLDEGQDLPASMHIVASICEDGLGLTSWWAGSDEVLENPATKKEEGEVNGS